MYYKEIVYVYFDLYFFLFNALKSDITTAQKILNNLINGNIFIKLLTIVCAVFMSRLMVINSKKYKS